jgi:anti-sigma factor RsiW
MSKYGRTRIKAVDEAPGREVADVRCRDTTQLVSAARDGEIDEAGLQALATHLKDCERCQHAKQQFTRMFEALDELLARTTDHSGNA